ncbi:MAG TPA: hypothetical protein VFN88_12330, partial [Caulobacteraceae bacterium]|nr:hypothetical protein [Caulobacteraceae bacterium]
MRLAICAAAALMLAAAAAAGPALAADEEIQVYMDEMNKTGHFGLDVHTNYVASGERIADFPGEQQTLHRGRITPEFSYGLTDNIELGAYLPLFTAIDGKASVDGVKGRIKFIAPHPESQRWFWGLNFELGKVDHRLDVNPWNAELKGIVGGRFGPWTLAANTNFDWAVKGPDTGPTTLQIATKATYDIAPDFTIGVESYNDLGPVRHLGGDL